MLLKKISLILLIVVLVSACSSDDKKNASNNNSLATDAQILDMSYGQGDWQRDYSDFTQLKEINLAGNPKKSPATVLTQVRKAELKKVFLSDNALINIPKCVWDMPVLEYLWLSNNRIAQIPDSISMLKNLRFLDLSNNNISVLTEEIAKLENLEELNLENNALTTLPLAVKELKNLKKINIKGNRIADEEMKRLAEEFEGLPFEILAPVIMMDAPGLKVK